MVLSRAEAMYQRDKNHPSVLIWSLGNESAGGKNFLTASRYFHRVDSRPVHYESVIHDPRYPETSDILSSMYFPAERIRDMLAEDSSRPAISCEYGHAMGNSFGGQKRYTDLTEEVPAYQGGFIWDYIDQAITKRDRYGQAFLAYGGDFDDRPTDYEFCGDGLVYGDDRAPSPKMQEVKYLYQNLRVQVEAGRVRVANRYLFTDAAEFDCVVRLHRQGELVSEAPMEVRAAPGETVDCPLPLWPEALDDEYTVTVVLSVCGRTRPGLRRGMRWPSASVSWGRFPPSSTPRGTWRSSTAGGTSASSGRTSVCCSPRASAVWSPISTGAGSCLSPSPGPTSGGRPRTTTGGPTSRAASPSGRRPASYGTAKAMPYSVPDMKNENSCAMERGDGWVRVTFRYLLPTQPRTACALSYRVFADGTVEAILDSDAGKVLGPMPEFSLLLKLDADFDRLRWYGRGRRRPTATESRGERWGSTRTGWRTTWPGICGPRSAEATPTSAGPPRRMGVAWACCSPARRAWISPPCPTPRRSWRARPTPTSCRRSTAPWSGQDTRWAWGPTTAGGRCPCRRTCFRRTI